MTALVLEWWPVFISGVAGLCVGATLMELVNHRAVEAVTHAAVIRTLVELEQATPADGK